MQKYCFNFKGKYEVKVKILNAEGKKDLTFILLPAIGVPIKKYQNLISGLMDEGYTVIAADYPCCGENSPHIDRNIDYGYKDLINDYIPKLLEFSKTTKTVLLGHSLGAHIATLYATQNDIPVIGVATGNIHYKNWAGLGKLNILRAVVLFKVLINIYGYLPGYKVGFGVKEAKTLMSDWCYTALTGNYDFFNKNIQKSSNKVLYINIKGDDFAPYQSTLKLAEMFHEYKLEVLELSTELKGNKHSIWLKEPKDVLDIINQKIGLVC